MICLRGKNSVDHKQVQSVLDGYKQYLKDTDRPAAIVSTLTFNSCMEAPKMLDAICLRIIYGGLSAMLGLDLFSSKWKAFVEKIEAQKSFF